MTITSPKITLSKSAPILAFSCTLAFFSLFLDNIKTRSSPFPLFGDGIFYLLYLSYFYAAFQYILSFYAQPVFLLFPFPKYKMFSSLFVWVMGFFGFFVFFWEG